MTTSSGLVLTFLLNALWQTALVAALALGLAPLRRRLPARKQHLLLLLALLLCVLLPAAAVLRAREGGAEHLLVRQMALQGPPAAADAAPGWLTRLGVWLLGPARLVEVAPPLAQILSGAYLLLLLRRGLGLVRAWRRTAALVRNARQREAPAALLAALRRCTAALRLPAVPVLWSAALAGPVTVGTRRPVILLPEGLAASLSEAEFVAVVGHELAHIRRRDFALNLVGELLVLPVSFHPLARLLKRRLDDTREMACDEEVAERVLDARSYASALVSLARTMRGPAPAYTLGVLCAHILEERVMRLIDHRPRLSGGLRNLLLGSDLALLFACGIAAAACSLRVGHDDKEAPQPAPAADTVLAPAGTTPTGAAEGEFSARREKLSGDLPRLSKELKAQHHGSRLSGEYEVCVSESGGTSSVKPVTSIPGADEAIVATLKTWTYRPQPQPVCYVEQFDFVIE